MSASQAEADDINPDAPFNAKEEESHYTCHECFEDVPDEQAEAALRYLDEVWCDKCLISNSESCGDWDGLSLAAKQRSK